MDRSILINLPINIKRKILKEFLLLLGDTKLYYKAINNDITFFISETRLKQQLHISAEYFYRGNSKKIAYIDNKDMRSLLKDTFNSVKNYVIKDLNLIQFTDANIDINKLDNSNINKIIIDIWCEGYFDRLLDTPTIKLLESI